jgi:hypothetical protein
VAVFDGVMPGEFLPTPSTENSVSLDYDLQFVVGMRKVEPSDIAADAALKMDLVFSWGRYNQAGSVLTTIGQTLPAFVSDNTADTSGIIGNGLLTFDIGAQIRTDIATPASWVSGLTPPYIRPGDWFKITLGPHASPDNVTGDNLELTVSPFLRWRRCAALYYSGSGTAGVNLGSTFRTIRGGGGA